MLRLDPAYPPLWRDATTVQFGLDAVAIVEHIEPWQERLVRELEYGLPPAALDAMGTALGGEPGEADRFVGRIRRALSWPEASNRREVVLQVSDTTPRDVAEALSRALGSAGFDCTTQPWSGVLGSSLDRATPVVMVGQHVIEPRRAAVVLGRDIPHLPVVFGGAAVEIGPFVRPGETACLACVAAHRIEADPAWPRLAAQLIGRPAPAVGEALVLEAGLAAARVLSDAERRPARRVAPSQTIHVATGARTTRNHRPHAACRCRSLAGIATALVPAAPATTTAREYARPA